MIYEIIYVLKEGQRETSGLFFCLFMPSHEMSRGSELSSSEWVAHTLLVEGAINNEAKGSCHRTLQENSIHHRLGTIAGQLTWNQFIIYASAAWLKES